jgi:hypothetical protein
MEQVKAPSITRESSSSRKKFLFQEGSTLEHRLVSTIVKHSSLEYKNVCTRKRTRKDTKESKSPPKQDAIKPVKENTFMENEKPKGTRQIKKSNKSTQHKDKGK